MKTEVRQQLFEANLDLPRRIAGNLAKRLPPNIDFEDLQQEGLIALWERTAKWDSRRGVGFRQFARSRVAGAMLDYVREVNHRGSNYPQMRSLEGCGFQLAVEGQARQRMEARDVRSKIWAAVDTLPAAERLVIVLHFFEGLKISIIGRMMGFSCFRGSCGRVSQLRKAALKRLRALFEIRRWELN